MIEFLGLILLRPFWLLALPALVGAAWLLRRRRRRIAAAWTEAIDPPLRAALEALGRVEAGVPVRAFGPAGLALAVAAILAVALAGPARETRAGASFRNLDGVVLLVDLGARASTTERLPAALMAARLLAEASGSRPVALVVYAGDAYLASGFTTDADALGTTIAVLDGETVPDRGDRPDLALALGRRLVAEAGILAADFVLIAPDAAPRPALLAGARAVAAGGHRLSVLVSAPSSQGAALEPVAQLGGGRAASVADPSPLAVLLADRPASRLAATGLSALVVEDLGRFVLIAALFPALLMFRRRG